MHPTTTAGSIQSHAYIRTQIRDVVWGFWTHYAASARNDRTHLYKYVYTYKLCL